jgi:hypothetical protein
VDEHLLAMRYSDGTFKSSKIGEIFISRTFNDQSVAEFYALKNLFGLDNSKVVELDVYNIGEGI